MRIVILLVCCFTFIHADLYEWNDTVFPPDPEWTLEQLKMKPMVSNYITFVGSGSHSLTSVTAMDRTRKGLEVQAKTVGGWESKQNAYQKKQGEDYKNR